MTRTLAIALTLALASGAFLLAQSAATAEDALRLQIVVLQSQLAQAIGAAATCEAEGPRSAKVAAEANAAAQALVQSLDARGLVIDPQTNAIVPKPPPPPEKP